jgi:hypothetical protein
MWQNVIGQQAQRCGQNLLLCNGFLIAFLAGFGLLCWRPLSQLIRGPMPVDPQLLLATTDPATLPNSGVTLDRGAAIDTEVEMPGEWFPNYKYLAVPIADRYLIVKVAPNHAGATHFEGTLEPMPGNLQWRLAQTRRFPPRSVAEEAPTEWPDWDRLPLPPLPSTVKTPGSPKEGPDWDRQALPIYLDTSKRPRRFGIMDGIVLSIPAGILLLAIWNVVRARRWMVNPETHPAVRGLQRIGSPPVVAAAIAAEMQHDGFKTLIGGRVPTPAWLIGPVLLSPSWLLRPRLFGVDLLHLDDVIWIHPCVTRTYVYCFPTLWTDHSVRILTRLGGTLEIECGEDDPEGKYLCRELLSRRPWLIRGYDDELAMLWKARRSELIAVVAERQRQFLNGEPCEWLNDAILRGAG